MPQQTQPQQQPQPQQPQQQRQHSLGQHEDKGVYYGLNQNQTPPQQNQQITNHQQANIPQQLNKDEAGVYNDAVYKRVGANAQNAPHAPGFRRTKQPSGNETAANPAWL
ncbi:hypothetical protein QCA50_017419 [Cerrena zonata]|uniref:Uncharacterized protein n=1 Tax=Cerrena zonata TaxID=2478898 RepID=A0AAW0FPV2_9APHY